MRAFAKEQRSLSQPLSFKRSCVPDHKNKAAITDADLTRVIRSGYDLSQIPVGAVNAIRIQPQLEHRTSGDVYEQEADRVAEQVMHGPGLAQQPARQPVRVQTLSLGPSEGEPIHAPAIVHDALHATGQPLALATRARMEMSFGHNFSHVRVRADEQAAMAARRIHARAFTVGNTITFGAGEYRPETAAGQRLLAHELTHVVQQAAATGRGRAVSAIQRKPTIEILDASSKATPKANQRQAKVSCPIKCGKDQVGTLHAMPLFYHVYDKDPEKAKIVKAGSPDATGIGSALHFIQSGKSKDCDCQSFRIIQVVETTHNPGEPRGGSIVDINTAEAHEQKKQGGGDTTPYYGDYAKNKKHLGEHEIPAGYPDKGERVETTESIYDRPSRDPQTHLKDHKDLSWMAEAHVACLRPHKPDKILGGVTYGFSRKFNSKANSYDPVVGIEPACLENPTKHFLDTLGTDPEVPNYEFEGKEKSKTKP